MGKREGDMRIPKSVKVGNIEYKIEITDETLVVNNHVCTGRIEYYKQVIKVSKDLETDCRFQTFLHELVHAIDEDRDIDLDEKKTEMLARGLAQVLKDNQDMFVADKPQEIE